jgi:DNA-binding NarL/FixJ family response regulator
VLVEDNDLMLRMLEHALADEPDLVSRRGAIDVNALMHEDAWRDVDVAVVDILLPGTTGDVLLTWLADHVPAVRRIAISGAGTQRLDAVVDAELALLKPFPIDELLLAIRKQR